MTLIIDIFAGVLIGAVILIVLVEITEAVIETMLEEK